MGKKKYYLVARNRDTNKVRTIFMDGKYGVSLEKIDLFTTSFINKNHLIDSLFKDGKIDTLNSDLFIINSYNNNIYYTELLFNNRKEINEIARSFLNNCSDDTIVERDIILDSFCKRMGNNSDYYDFVMYGNHNISLKYIGYFQDSRYSKMYENKFKQGEWARNSYSLIHNILESYDRFEMNNNYEVLERNKIKNTLLDITDSNYSYYDNSLLDLLDDVKVKNNSK